MAYVGLKGLGVDRSVAVPHTQGTRQMPPDQTTVLLPQRRMDVQRFQQFHGLRVTGVVDHETQQKVSQLGGRVATGGLSYGGPR